jgi:UDP-N-acetylmuramoyl-L-alanyl-D-glutamate--2,6-diaminopimelate ligase
MSPLPHPLLHPLLREAGVAVPPGLPNPQVRDVSCDSRRIAAGSLFVGLPGGAVDGGRFWPQALAAGAVAAVIGAAAAAAEPPGPGDAVIVVADPVATWAGQLAAAFWEQPSQQLALIGVTGTNGKTTTTCLIEHLASACGSPVALFGTLVNRWPGHSQTASHTTAFADLLQAQLAQAVAAGARIGAMEVSSHGLDQGRSAGCQFAGAVFTNLTQDHLDYHGSMEAYFEAKAKLFAPPLFGEPDTSTQANPLLAAKAVVNSDDAWGARLAERLSGVEVQLRTGNGQPGGRHDGPSAPTDLDLVEAVIHRTNLTMHRRLTELGQDHVFDDWGAGTHSWPYWTDALAATLPALMAATEAS